MDIDFLYYRGIVSLHLISIRSPISKKQWENGQRFCWKIVKWDCFDAVADLHQRIGRNDRTELLGLLALLKMESFFLCQEHFWNHGMLTYFKNPDTKKTDFHCNYYYHLPPNTSQQRLSPSLGNERKLSATNGVDHSIFAATGLHHEFGITRLSNTFIREYGHLQATHFYKRLQEWYRPLPSKGSLH